MSESSNRRGSLRLPRVRGGNSRNSSIRSSAVYDEFRQPSGPHPLRATSSRYSLNEQFAATRQEYELWDDDASSVYERVTNASEAGDTEGEKILVSSTEDFGVLYNANAMGQSSEMRDWDYYDVLCLPRDTDLSQDQIRRAYYRLFLLFYPDSYPEHLRPIARQQFLRAQEAFEALIDPARRAQYDVAQLGQGDQGPGTMSYGAAFYEAFQDRIQNSFQTSFDLGLRLDATRAGRYGRSSSWPPRDTSLKLMDFALSHSVSASFPTIRNALQPQVSRLERFAASKEVGSLSEPTIELSTPTITVSSSVYGVALPFWPTAPLFDRHHPLLPAIISRRRFIQLLENRFTPKVTVKYRQEIVNRAPVSNSDNLRWVKTGIEVESDVLPESISSRLYHHITLPNTSEPTIVETSIESARSHLAHSHPRLAVGIHQNLFHGSGFIRADSGDWAVRPRETYRNFANSSRANPNVFSVEFPPKISPSLELGFRTTPLAHISEFSNSSNAEIGIRRLEHDVKSSPDGSWAISASATPNSVSGFVRYSKDLTIPFLTPEPDSLPPSARLEVELCSDTFQDHYLALRNLWSVDRVNKLGLEVGISQHHLHVSLYWACLGKRISLPLLISPREFFSPGIVFWAGAVPFASLAALQLILRRRGGRRKRSKPEVSEAKVKLLVARRRYEADNLTVLLAQPVEARQKRQMSLGGLVILSAKFGIPSEQGAWAGAEVADVTIALAALIDDITEGGRLIIPKGVKKSRVPGFWDPAPGKEKRLHVEYSWKGAEAVVEVRGRDELILPPPPAQS
ncbi:Fc.00g021230.m01.CDS01 [Cosmosporella sp. VM-42]